MKTACLKPVIVLTMTCLSLASMAQTPAPTAVPTSPPESTASASVPTRTRPGPRLLTPVESRDSATQPGDVRPEHAVTPQVSIPLGKTPPAARTPEPIGAKRNRPAADAGVDDAVARCEAQIGEQVRAKCRDRLAREARRP